MYVKVLDNDITEYSLEQLRRDNPLVSFADVVSQQVLLEYGVYPAVSTSAPVVPATQVAEPAGFEYLNGTYTQTWRIRDMDVQELAQYALERKMLRAEAYREYADPLFFKYQRGEATQQEWLDKVAEIKSLQ